jgi:anti-sigma-K factor RskA
VNDERERSQFQSRLPDDGAYWADLAERIVGSAEPILREHAETQVWWHPLARWSPVIGVAAAVAALLVVLAGPPAADRPDQVSLGQLLSPEDPVAQAVVSQAAVNDIAAMLLVESGGRQ